MNATLNFDLPEDDEQFAVASKARELYFCLCEMDEWLRGKIKHGDYTEEAYDALQEARDELNNIMRDNDVFTDMMS